MFSPFEQMLLRDNYTWFEYSSDAHSSTLISLVAVLLASLGLFLCCIRRQHIVAEPLPAGRRKKKGLKKVNGSTSSADAAGGFDDDEGDSAD